MILTGNIKDKHCPVCKSKDFRRIKRSLLFKLFSWGGRFKRYQCTRCWKTVYLLPGEMGEDRKERVSEYHKAEY